MKKKKNQPIRRWRCRYCLFLVFDWRKDSLEHSPSKKVQLEIFPFRLTASLFLSTLHFSDLDTKRTEKVHWNDRTFRH